MSQKWGTILVIGGAGRLGYFVIQELLKQPECGRIVSINRKLHEENQHEVVEYRAVDVRAAETLRTLMYDVKPEAIINTAAPGHVDGSTPVNEFHEVLVTAQASLIDLARLVGTKVFITTSSANVAGGWEHVSIDETAPYWPETSSFFPYWIKKAAAERELLAADSPTLQTVSLRLPLIIGERDYAFVPSLLKTLEQGQTGVQIGNNTGRLATISAEDGAVAHVLALRRLLQPGNDVHGQIFYITNTRALPFWTMAQIVWTAAGWKKTREPFVVPEALAMCMALVSEWFVYLTSFGRRAAVFNQRVVYFMCREWTYDESKAERTLGFVPKNDVEEQLKRSVEWELRKRKK
ncbi:hypothetical protein M409DRAFT_19025 [Zasmidium cellare ATCC 36951]|uniref:3-beta hydroxysteroid dehydrogenase/isomerase domain-containing protein n=1 Tax=Zasmidium cellare ATCC 36951 TaxID=1080233 RepID=A0A6A6CYU3_ZASCE|nr:uncharacterized protein M409DRAFT_19025 [Zasmidium cellare ATCC 36951]KAF2171052.1 hypothetical protein M409DRAFT_19025 [Zasmidium cellare ATCC 36951]